MSRHASTDRPPGLGPAAWAGLAVAGALAAVAAEAATYPRWRSWCLTWGTAADEADRALPGDELLAEPDIVSTRAIGVDAAPRFVWPWLVQMGPGRGGLTPTTGSRTCSASACTALTRVLPQYQHLKVGDEQQLGRRGPVLRVARLEPERCLVLRSDDGNWVWAFTLALTGQETRLISRNRIGIPGASRLVPALYAGAMEPGSLIMERKMLLGIKQRAERLAREAGPDSLGR